MARADSDYATTALAGERDDLLNFLKGFRLDEELGKTAEGTSPCTMSICGARTEGDAIGLALGNDVANLGREVCKPCSCH